MKSLLQRKAQELKKRAIQTLLKKDQRETLKQQLLRDLLRRVPKRYRYQAIWHTLNAKADPFYELPIERKNTDELYEIPLIIID